MAQIKSDFTPVVVKIEQLVPNPRNPRIDLKPGNPQYEKLKRSIRKSGYVAPIIWNKTTGYIVSGHQRLTVLKDIAEEDGKPLTELNVLQIEKPAEEADVLMIALNKITGIQDEEKTQEIFRYLEECGTVEDLTLTGFEQFEIDKYLEDAKEEDQGEEEADDSTVYASSQYKLVLMFENQEEMDSAYNELTSQGYAVKKK